MAGTAWQGIIQAAKTYQANESTNNDTSNDRTLLLGGCVDGYIVVFDWKDKKNPGKVIFKIEVTTWLLHYKKLFTKCFRILI